MGELETSSAPLLFSSSHLSQHVHLAHSVDGKSSLGDFLFFSLTLGFLQGDYICRHNSNDTSDSSVPSALNTPADEQPLHPIDVILQEEIDHPWTPRPPTIPEDIKRHTQDSLPKVKSLSRAVSKARKLAQTLTRSSKVSKVRCFTTDYQLSLMSATPTESQSGTRGVDDTAHARVYPVVRHVSRHADRTA